MIAIAGAAAVFGILGVNQVAVSAIAAFFVSTLVIKPRVWQEWLVSVIAVFGALPGGLLAAMYTFALQAALFLGHWPQYNNPDPKSLPDHFEARIEILGWVIPAVVSVALTCIFLARMKRIAPRSRRLSIAFTATILLWFFSYCFVGADPFGVMNWIAD
jgi:hypothetical protein